MSKPIITWKTPNHDRTRCHYFHLSKTKTDSNILDSYCFDLFYNILYTSYIFLHLPTSSYTFVPVYPHLWCYMKSPPECTSRNDRGHQSWSVQCEDLPPNLRWRNPGTISWSASSKIRKKNTTKSHSYHFYFVQFNAFFVHFVNFSFLENPTPNQPPGEASVSPERWETMTPQPANCDMDAASMAWHATTPHRSSGYIYTIIYSFCRVIHHARRWIMD